MFKRSATLYLPEFDDIDKFYITRAYNCSELEDPT